MFEDEYVQILFICIKWRRQEQLPNEGKVCVYVCVLPLHRVGLLISRPGESRYCTCAPPPPPLRSPIWADISGLTHTCTYFLSILVLLWAFILAVISIFPSPSSNSFFYVLIIAQSVDTDSTGVCVFGLFFFFSPTWSLCALTCQRVNYNLNIYTHKAVTVCNHVMQQTPCHYQGRQTCTVNVKH